MHPDISEVRTLNESLSEDLLTEQASTLDPEPTESVDNIDLSKMNRHQRRTIQALTRRAAKKVRK